MSPDPTLRPSPSALQPLQAARAAAACGQRPDHCVAALRVCAILARQGVDPKPLLVRAGISSDLAEAARTFVSTPQMIQLLRVAHAALNDDFLGLTEYPSRYGTLHYMMELGLRCKTLEAFLEHCTRFMSLLVDDVKIDLVRQHNEAVLRIHLRRPELDPDHFLIDNLLFFWHRTLSWSVGYLIPLTRLDVTFAEPPNQERFCYWVCKHWHQVEAQSALHFDIRYLTLPVVRTPQEWQQQFGGEATDAPEWPESEHSWSMRLKALLHANLEQLRTPPGLDEAAASLGIGTRTLRRHLHREGFTYQQVLDQLLRDEAIEKLHVHRLSVADVAEQLGFAEARSFSRAFKRWTGVPPTRYIR